MNHLLQEITETVQRSRLAFCKFISANDCGKTGGHQTGFYIPKNSVPLMFDTPGMRGENKDRFITIKWQKDFETNSRFIYYGKGTRNEYRLTRFGRGFPFLTQNNVGDLFILAWIDEDYYEGFVLSTDEDIEDFFAAFNLSPTSTNQLIDKDTEISPENKLINCFIKYIHSLSVDFPPTIDVATNARNCHNSAYKITEKFICDFPDNCITSWIRAEYDLFKTLENNRYGELIKNPFDSVEELVRIANTILNRRKSRAGKSLEHHLEAIFRISNLTFDTQATTEGKKKPDFLFPSQEDYHDLGFDTSSLIVLAAKTTCKDRWRQILNEADRIKTKHLFTLQQGISINQLNEMYKYGVQLVTPKQYIKSFPKEYKDRILTLKEFIQVVYQKQK
jgi:hypothetical protein